MTLLPRLFRSVTPAQTRSISTFSLGAPRIAPSSSSLLPLQQHRLTPQSSSCRQNLRASSTPAFVSARRHTTRPPNPLTDDKKPSISDEEKARMQARRDEEPAYLLYFTCKPCSHRSAHRVTKHGYHKGTVLIACPNCDNRHVMSDHLKIFMNKPVTLDEILAQKGQKVTKGTMTKGDMEWWGEDESAQQKPEETTDTPEKPNNS